MNTDTEALVREVRDLAARRDIYDVVCRYMRGQDRLLPALQMSAFYEDARVDCGLFAGSAAEFVEFAQGFLGDLQSSHHLIGQAHIQVDGNEGRGEVYFFAQHRLVDETGEEKDLFVSGRYQDRYENRGDGWKIAERREVVDWARTDSAADGFLAENRSIILGHRGEDG